MRIIYSLTTDTLFKLRWGDDSLRWKETIKSFCLSILLTKKIYPQVELWTDDIGKRLFSHLGIPIVLLKGNPKKYSTFWIKSKMEVLDKVDNCIHIDGDIFIETAIFSNKTNADGIIERIEVGYYRDCYNDVLSLTNQYFRHSDFWVSPKEIPYSYNCGIIGFFNKDLKKDFFIGFEKLLYHYNSNTRLENEELCIILEQYNLACITHIKQYNLATILGGDTIENQIIDAKNQRYNHLFGKIKYESFWLNWVEDLLKNRFEKEYVELLKKII